MLAQLHQAHRFLQTQATDALAQPFFGNEPLGGAGIRNSLVHLFVFPRHRLGHTLLTLAYP